VLCSNLRDGWQRRAGPRICVGFFHSSGVEPLSMTLRTTHRNGIWTDRTKLLPRVLTRSPSGGPKCGAKTQVERLTQDRGPGEECDERQSCRGQPAATFIAAC
jgi:hypothetical protein